MRKYYTFIISKLCTLYFCVLLTLASLMSCGQARESGRDLDPLIGIWTINSLSFNDEEVPLDKCTSEDYLDIRSNNIALSFHCEYSIKDSVPNYHIHKLNWKQVSSKMYKVFSDDHSMEGSIHIDEDNQLELFLKKSGGRIMQAIYEE